MNKKAKTILRMLGMIVLTGIIILASTSCIRIVGMRGSGNVKSEDRNVSGFDRVSVSSGMNLYLKQGSSESLTIEAEDSIIPRIQTVVKNGELKIRYKYSVLGSINLYSPTNIYLTVKDLRELDVSSGVTVESEEINSDSLKVDLSSGADGKMIITANKLVVDLSSGSRLEISGQADEQNIDLGSGGEYDARDLISKSVVIDASSGSNAVVNASENLEVDISSGATVEYSGSPKVISDISSGGVLRSISND